VPVYAFTHGDPAVAAAALDRAGLRTYLREVLSTQAVRAFKPAPRTYRWDARRWTRHRSAPRCSLRTRGTCTAPSGPASSARSPPRLEGWVPDVVDRPHVVAERLDDT
jgi:2-haloacid dehalogenase